MTRAPLRFRIKMAGRFHVRVHVYDTRKEMHSATKEVHGDRCHPKEQANTIVFSDAPGGCLAVMHFVWKYAQPHIVAHESLHAAVACAVKLGPGLSPDEDEPLAGYVEKIFRAVNRRIHA